MKVLVDTHIVISLLRDDLLKKHPDIAALLSDPETVGYLSAASIWEIAIKTRLGKLDIGMPLLDAIGYLSAMGLVALSVEATHAIADLQPLPHTRDPFDRLLLAQCQVESLQLVTLDRALVRHPLAWQA